MRGARPGFGERHPGAGRRAGRLRGHCGRTLRNDSLATTFLDLL
ncbi:hypothetical protein [Lentzea pudingi]|nr:hypothetical protein [Lentzea pudingi]